MPTSKIGFGASPVIGRIAAGAAVEARQNCRLRERGTRTMKFFSGLDVGMDETAVCRMCVRHITRTGWFRQSPVRRNGRCQTESDAIPVLTRTSDAEARTSKWKKATLKRYTTEGGVALRYRFTKILASRKPTTAN